MIAGKSPEWRARILNAPRRYDTPSVSTNQLVEVIRKVVGYGFARVDGDPILNLLDVIRENVLDVTPQSVKIATFMIGEDYETRDIQCACLCLRDGGPAFKCTKIKDEHRKAIDELLEAKP